MVQAARQMNNNDVSDYQLIERVVKIRRVTKVVKGGRRRGFSVMVVVGDGEGNVGAGLGKAYAVPDAVRKAVTTAKSNMIHVPIKGTTIPHQITSKFCASTVLLKPAPSGTGVIAGGIRDIFTKSIGNGNAINVVKATIAALLELRDKNQEIAKRRGPS